MVFSCLLASTLGLSCRSLDTSNVKIAGGEAVLTSGHEMANAVSRSTVKIILPLNRGSCTGTIVAKRLVLTAAHCMELGEFEASLYPSIEYTIEYPAFGDRSHLVKRDEGVVLHPDYINPDSILVTNDIAMIKLRDDIPENYQPAFLIAGNAQIRPITFTDNVIRTRGQKFIVAGFGKIAQRTRISDFRMTEMELYTLDTENGRLALADDDSGVCSGDSGGPVFIEQDGELVLAAIISSATCDVKWSRDEDREEGEIQLYALFSADLRNAHSWLKSSLTASEWRQIKTKTVSYTPMSRVRSEPETRRVLDFINGEIDAPR